MAYTEANLNYYKKNPTHITADLDIGLLLELIDYNSEYIKYIKPQSAELIYAAYDKDPTVFKHVDFSKVSIQFLEKVVAATPGMIQYIYYPSPEIMKLALSKDLNVFPHIQKWFDDAMFEWLLSKNGLVLEFIPASKQTERMVMIALQENIESYQYAHIKTKATDVYLVNKDPKKISWVSKYWSELIIPLIRYNPRYITKFYNTPEVLTMEAVKLALDGEPMLYKTLPNKNDFEVMKYAVSLDISLLEYIPYNQRLIEYTINNNGLALKYIRKKDLLTIRKAVTNNVLALDYVNFRRKIFIDYAFALDGMALKYLENPTYNQCLDAVKRNPYSIQFVPSNHMNKELQLYALYGGSKVIPFITTPVDNDVIIQMIKIEPGYIFRLHDPTLLMYVTAFSTEGRLILFYPNWNEYFGFEEISAALAHDGTIFEELKNKTKTLAMVAIKQYPPAIQWVKFQDLEMANLAVSGDPTTLFFVDKEIMDSKLLSLALELDPEFFTRTAGEMTWEQWLVIIGRN